MKHYTHLAQEERYQIHALMKAGHPQKEIAAFIGRSPSTVGRELRRNRGQRGYRPRQAQAMATARASAARTRPRMGMEKGTQPNGTYLSPNVGRVSVICVTRQALRSNTGHSLRNAR
jgi:hypothetical protein